MGVTGPSQHCIYKNQEKNFYLHVITLGSYILSIEVQHERTTDPVLSGYSILVAWVGRISHKIISHIICNQITKFFICIISSLVSWMLFCNDLSSKGRII